MQKTQLVFIRTSIAILASMLLVGCSSGGRSLLALEDQKAELRAAFAKRIGVNPQEVDQALVSTPEQERKSAKAVTQQLLERNGASPDVAMGKHLQQVADRLAVAVDAKDRNFRVVLLNNSQANAFTPGAGTILVNDGLLRLVQNEAQIAAVMAHEMAHDIARHPQRQKQIRLASKAGGHFMTNYTPDSLVENVGRALRIGGSATMNGMIRQQEMMADSIGIEILVKAGYDPREMVKLLQTLRMGSPAKNRMTNVVYGNHPLTIDREKAAIAKINRLYRTVAGETSSPSFDALVKPYHQRRVKRLAENK